MTHSAFGIVVSVVIGLVCLFVLIAPTGLIGKMLSGFKKK